MKKKKIIFDLYSDETKTNEVLQSLKAQPKIYSKIISSLQLLGDFVGRTSVEIYDSVDDEQKILLCCEDENSNIFLFCGMSSNRKDRLKITKITNNSEEKYDISLSKKFLLTKDNIEFTRADKEYSFKFGRLVTDNNSFYSLFLSGDIGYHIEGDFNANVSHELLDILNKFENIPNLQEYISVFDSILSKKQITFTLVNISAYKNFERVGFINLNNQQKAVDNQVKLLNKSNKLYN